MTLTPDEAIGMLDLQVCPACNEPTLPEIECDEERAVAFETCKNKHIWPYSRFSEDRSTNAFDGEFDPTTIEEKLDEYREETT